MDLNTQSSQDFAQLELEAAAAGRGFAVEVIADSSGTWAGNACLFPTIQLAQSYAEDLAFRWTSVRQYRIIVDPRPANANVRQPGDTSDN